MPRFRVLPYKQGSKGAKALAEALGGKVLKLVGSKFVPKDDDVIINWGNTNTILEGVLNTAGRIKGASNKLLFFNNMAAVNPEIIPKFWTQKEDIPNEEYPIVCRTVLAGHSGEGIVIADSPADLVDCPLYVKYMKKKEEYRVHLGRKGDEPSVIVVQRKAKCNGAENVNWKIRSHNNGFVFVRNNVNPPPCVIEAAIKSFEASSLDFGAIDVIYNSQTEKAYVLEINTAPGLEGTTVTDYATYFKDACST